MTVSIVIPSFNRVDSVERLLISISRQSLLPVEVIVIDQNNFELSQKVAVDWFEGLQFVKQKVPNVSTARNSGALRATGSHILFLDDDIVLDDPDFLRKVRDFYQNRLDVKCMCPYIMQSDFRVPRLFYEYPENFLERDSADESLFKIKEAGSLAIFFERRYFLESGGFDPHLFEFAGTSEDQELFFRMNLKGMSVYAHKDFVVFHDHYEPGGCELRTSDYWKTRRKCTRSWVLMKYILKNSEIKALNLQDKLALARSSFLNSRLFFRHPNTTLKEYTLLLESLKEAEVFFQQHSAYYRNSPHTNHLENISNG